MLSLLASLALTLTLATGGTTDPPRVSLADGETPIGTFLVCNSCADPSTGEACLPGTEHGWLQGQQCGECLAKSNFSRVVRYGRDLVLIGTIVAPDGSPRAGRYVKLFLANSWTVRTRTAEDGRFRLRLGATAERSGDPTLALDVGTHVDPGDETSPHFAAYLLPADFSPCQTAPPPAVR
jgi:hypothetical protein